MSMFRFQVCDVIDAIWEAGLDPWKVGNNPMCRDGVHVCNTIPEYVSFCEKVAILNPKLRWERSEIVKCRMLENN